MEFYIGTISIFGFNFAPRNWAYCNGQTIAISSNTALFSLLGTTYGGNGTTTFGLPNLQGRAALDNGQAAGGSLHNMGESGGSESVTVLTSNMPAHNHTISLTMKGNDRDNLSQTPQGGYPALSANSVNIFNNTANTTMKGPLVALGATGSNFPIGINDPYIVMNYCICQYGVFPARG